MMLERAKLRRSGIESFGMMATPRRFGRDGAGLGYQTIAGIGDEEGTKPGNEIDVYDSYRTRLVSLENDRMPYRRWCLAARV